MIYQLTQETFFLLALCWLQTLNARCWKDRQFPAQIASGIMFGVTMVAGMMSPITLAPGIIIDPRMVVLSMAGLFGGPLVVGIAFLIAAGYRLWLGGAGATVGTIFMIQTMALALAYRYAVKRGWVGQKPAELLAFGLLVHGIFLMQLIRLPGLHGVPLHPAIFSMLVTMPIGTLVLGLLLQDMQQRQDVERELQQSRARMRAIARAMPDLLLVLDEDGRYLEINAPEAQLLFAPAAELLGRRMHEVLPQPVANLLLDFIHRTLASEKTQNIEYLLPTQDGIRAFEARAQALEIRLNGRRAVAVLTRDITERKSFEDEIRKLAYLDPLTGLPNRRLLLDRLHQAQLDCQSSGMFGALLSIDLDNFKNINDLCGHPLGDKLLQQVAERLQRTVPSPGTVARLGGDEFIILLEELSTDPHQAARRAEEIGQDALAAMSQPYAIGPHIQRGSGSIGIVLFSSPHPEDELLQWADMAMYTAKNAGKNTIRLFDPAIQEEISSRLQLENEIQLGMQNQEFRVFYQPLFSEAGGKISMVGVEALLRWQHPQHGLIPPGRFIPVAERAGLMPQLDRWVLGEACRQLALWAHDPALAHLTLSVNISGGELHQPDFITQCLEALELSGASPAQLTLELTESVLISDITQAGARMALLKQHGVRFALDDFGTGYSSLSYLQQLPFDQLKIDQSFVRGLPHDKTSLAIIQAIIGLAGNFGFKVLAEGIETEEQRAVIALNGCMNYQGYLFARPMPPEQIGAVIAAR